MLPGRVLREHGVGGTVSAAEAEAAEINIKYSGFIRRQAQQQAAVAAKAQRPLPPALDYRSIDTLSLEAREKLAKVTPPSRYRSTYNCHDSMAVHQLHSGSYSIVFKNSFKQSISGRIGRGSQGDKRFSGCAPCTCGARCAPPPLELFLLLWHAPTCAPMALVSCMF